MALGLTPEQQALSDAVGQFAARHAPVAATRDNFAALADGQLPDWWDALVANGFHAVHLPEHLGGQGGRLIDAACVLESAAKALLPGPLLPTVTAGAVALLADPAPAADSLVRELASGVPAAIVLPDNGEFQARAEGERLLITGESDVTAGVCAARVVVIGARTQDGGVVWLPVDTRNPAATVESLNGTDLVCDVGILRLGDYEAAPRDVLDGIDTERAEAVAVGLVASAMAGITQWCVEEVTAYLRTREQFGKVIGTFQALQHSAAMLLVNSELATAAAWDAVRAADEPPDQHRIAAAGAATIAISPIPDLVLDALTLFGAIGYTWEHDLHLYWRRAISLAGSIGPASRWARLLGRLGCAKQRDMSVNLGDADSDFRSWVAETLDAALQLRNDKPGRQGDYENHATGPQRTLIAEAGLIAPHWPAPWGVDAGPLRQLIIDEEFAKRPGLVRPSLGIAEWILPAVLAGAPRELQESLIPGTQRNDITWCQLFSEPGSGSDLAGATTRAEFKGNRWVINGQKVWTTSAHHADYGLLLARTDVNVPKHQGLSYFVLEIRQPGVEVRPLRQMNGHASFNQVFFTDAEVPPDLLVSEVGRGWAVATTTLMHERRGADGISRWGQSTGRVGKIYDEERAENATVMEPYKWYPQRAGRVDLVVERAQASGRNTDPVVRQEIAKLLTMSKAAEWTARRARAAQMQGRPQGPEGSLGKLVSSHVARAAARVHTMLLGADAMLTGEDSPMNGLLAEILVSVPAGSIAGGTDEIQRNIISERVLGMPKEPRTDNDRPFRDVPKNLVV